MRNGMRIFDVDRHVMEPFDLWTKYLPPEMREYAPRLEPISPPGESLAARLERLREHALLPSPNVPCVQGKPIMRDVTEAAYIETALIAGGRRESLAAAETAAGHLATMDATGVDAAMLLPTFAPFLVYDDDIDAARSRAYADAYNRWLAELCAEKPDRLFGAALISRHDPEAMVGDVEQAIGRGLHAVVVRPNPVLGRTLSEPRYAPFWTACAQQNLTVLIHEGTHTNVATTGRDRFGSHFGQHACSHPLEMMMAVLSLIEGGVLETCPELRVGFLEAGSGWLPYWLWRLDHVEYAQMHGEVAERVRKRPSEYFRRQCWIAFEPDEALLGAVIDEVGRERFVFGSDFPHLDHGPAIVDAVVALQGAMGSETLTTMLWDNAAKLLGPRCAPV